MGSGACAQQTPPNCLGSLASQWTNCLGSKSFASGNYVGEWKDGKRRGRGIFTNIDGRKYIGDWRHDHRDGRGIQYSSDGTVIASGDWYEGKLVGSFLLDVSRYPFTSLDPVGSLPNRANKVEISINENKYVGEWKDKKRDGRGVEYSSDGSIAASGDWYAGKLVGSFERVNIVILDACCNNNLFGSRSLNRGLGRMDAPAGTFLSYSTAPGRVTADGSKGERNSPFTGNLLKAIQQPGQPIEEVFKEVRRNVTRETNGAQVPWESTSLTGSFSFRLVR
jgi:hypothetical protein